MLVFRSQSGYTVSRQGKTLPLTNQLLPRIINRIIVKRGGEIWVEGLVSLPRSRKNLKTELSKSHLRQLRFPFSCVVYIVLWSAVLLHDS